jgi:hypothetical protein
VIATANTLLNARFGSSADIAAVLLNVRFTPKADITEKRCHVRFVPQADLRCWSEILRPYQPYLDYLRKMPTLLF